MPSSSPEGGMRRSVITTSGRWRSTAASSVSPSSHEATTSSPVSRATTWVTASRIRKESSARATRSGAGSAPVDPFDALAMGLTVPPSSPSCLGGIQVAGEILERRLGLRRLLAADVHAAAGEERPSFHRDLEHLLRRALGRELDDARAVRVQPHLG